MKWKVQRSNDSDLVVQLERNITGLQLHHKIENVKTSLHRRTEDIQKLLCQGISASRTTERAFGRRAVGPLLGLLALLVVWERVHCHAFSALSKAEEHGLRKELRELKEEEAQLQKFMKTLAWPKLTCFQAFGETYNLPLRSRTANKSPTAAELGYLGGFFDGDGCVRPHADLSGCQLRITQLAVNAKVLILFRRFFGGGICIHSQGIGIQQPVLQWVISGEKARAAARQLCKVCLSKTEQLQLASNWPCDKDERRLLACKLHELKQCPPKIKKQSRPSWAHLAGLFDSDGCIHLSQRMSLSLILTQKYEALLVRSKTFLNSKLGTPIAKVYARRACKCHDLIISEQKAVQVVLNKLLSTGLTVKSCTAKCALSLREDNHALIREQISSTTTGNQGRYTRLDLEGCKRSQRIQRLQKKKRQAQKRNDSDLVAQLERNITGLQLHHKIENVKTSIHRRTEDIQKLLCQGISASRTTERAVGRRAVGPFLGLLALLVVWERVHCHAFSALSKAEEHELQKELGELKEEEVQLKKFMKRLGQRGICIHSQGIGIQQPVLQWVISGEKARAAARQLCKVCLSKTEQLQLASNWPCDKDERRLLACKLHELKQCPPKIKKQSRSSWAHLAGLFDSDGCICLDASGMSLSLRISQKYEALLVRGKTFLNSKLGAPIAKVYALRAKYVLQIRDQKAVQVVLNKLLDAGLTVKSRTAKCALSLREDNHALIRDQISSTTTGNQGRYTRLDAEGCKRSKRIWRLQIRKWKAQRRSDSDLVVQLKRDIACLQLYHEKENVKTSIRRRTEDIQKLLLEGAKSTKPHLGNMLQLDLDLIRSPQEKIAGTSPVELGGCRRLVKPQSSNPLPFGKGYFSPPADAEGFPHQEEEFRFSGECRGG
ncbi:unnamed protein product [Durusdinium trenchii]